MLKNLKDEETEKRKTREVKMTPIVNLTYHI